MFDHESLALMAQALAICLVLTGIHGYLGLHVLERKVIFVDLAMAQIAALGATFAIFLGYDTEHQPAVVYVFSLGFTLIGAAVFSLTRMRTERVPQEAFIGIVYATASAVAILILAKSTTAGEHIKGMLVGNILQARWPDIGVTALIYGAIGAFHWFFRDRFLRITMDPQGARAAGLNVRLWDFLFYCTFGVVITSSVAVAGVLLVFSFLVVPAAIGVMFAEGPLRRLVVAWTVGTLVSFLGIWFTFFEGTLPAGPVVVAAFALSLIVAGAWRYLRFAPALGPALGRLGLGALAVAALAVLSLLVRKPAEEHAAAHHTGEFETVLAELKSGDETVVLHAIDHLREHPDPHAVPALLEVLDRTSSDRVIGHLADALRRAGDRSVVPALRRAAARSGIDASLKLTLAEAILDLHDPAGLGLLIEVFVDRDAPRLPRSKALQRFDRLTGRASGYQLDGDPARLARIRDWWREHGTHIKWRETTGRFE